LGTGAVSNSGTLQINRSDAFSLSQAISGTGALAKLGAGTLTLTGGNTYSGTTTISAGTLEVGSGGTAGRLGTGAVSNSGTLQINRSDNLTLANAIGGTGALVKSGSNTLTLTGALTYSGNSTISGGTLVLSNDAPSPLIGAFIGTGALRIEPTSADFSGAFDTTVWTFPSTLGGLTIGKPSSADGTSDQALTIGSAIGIAGPVTL
jgi:autotransporter-associated beta strand protein